MELVPHATRYFAGLAAVAAGIQATDANGTGMPFDAAAATAIRLIRARTAEGRKLLFVGNGGSAAIASHMALDYWKNGGMRALAFNDASLLTCLGNDYGYEHVFEKPIDMFADRGDVLMAISSSGQSANIRAAVRAGRAQGCHVVTFSGFAAENWLRGSGEINFYVPSHSYGQVEIVHLAICHCILDVLIAQRAPD